jgi:hypothetical protein
MALLDAYVTDEEYGDRANSGRVPTDTDLLGAQLVAMTRQLERELGYAPGAMNHVEGVTLELDAIGGRTLYLRDEAGRGVFVSAVAAGGIEVDTARDGSFSGAVFDLDEPWVRGARWDSSIAAETVVPVYSAFELLPRSGALLTSWPDGPATVRLTCDTGFPGGVPDAVKEVVVSMTRDLRDHHAAGSSGQYQGSADDSLPLSDQTWRLIRSLKQQYSRRLPVVA